MASSDEFRSHAHAIWEASYAHPFVQGIGDGTLPEERFRYYLAQDYVYLIEFSRFFALAAAKARASDHAVSIPAGDYPVVLGSLALMRYAGNSYFAAVALTGSFGARLTAESLKMNGILTQNMVKVTGFVEEGALRGTERALTASCGMARPNSSMLPEVGRTRSIIMRIVVVFPAPFGPTSPSTSPGSTRNERSLTAVVELYFLVSRSTSIIFGDRPKQVIHFKHDTSKMPFKIVPSIAFLRPFLKFKQ